MEEDIKVVFKTKYFELESSLILDSIINKALKEYQISFASIFQFNYRNVGFCPAVELVIKKILEFIFSILF